MERSIEEGSIIFFFNTFGVLQEILNVEMVPTQKKSEFQMGFEPMT